MRVDQFLHKACCGKSKHMLRVGKPLSFELLKDYNLSEKYKKYGIIYIESSDYILTATLGSNILQIQCVTDKCNDAINILISKLEQL